MFGRFVRGERRDYAAQAIASMRPSMFGGAGALAAPVAEPDIPTAVRHDAVFACVDLLSDLFATLPVGEFRKGDGTRTELTPSSIVDRPSALISQVDWRTQVWTSLLLRGNAYGLVTEWERGTAEQGVMWPRTIELLNPDSVSWDARSGQYKVGSSGELHDSIRCGGDLWHVAGLTIPGFRFGLSPLMAAAASIMMGLNAQGFGSKWFADGAHPSAIIKSEHDLDQSQSENIKRKIVEVLNGSREPIVMGAGLDYQPISVTAEESQFLATIGANTSTIARIFRVPVEMIGGSVGGGSLTYASVEMRSLQFLTYSAQSRLARFEAHWSDLLPRGRYVKHNVDALLRVDFMTRVRGSDMQIRNGTMSPDEVRALEERPPIPDGLGAGFLWPPGGVKLDTGADPAGPTPLPGA